MHMTEAARAVEQSSETDVAPLLYEQPLNERMRTFLRLEFLFKQVQYLATKESSWDSRGAASVVSGDFLYSVECVDFDS